MKQVSLADTLDEYQTYVEGSFQIDGNDKTVSVTASDENIQTLTYDFGAGDGIKANTDYVITYKTKTADSVYYDGEDEKTFKTDETVISNTARLLDGEANNIGEKTAEVPVKPEWVIKDYKLEGNTITWTLEIMPNQRSVSSVTVHDRYTKFLELRGEPRIISGSATLSDAAVAPSSVDGYMEMSFDLTGITDAVKIEYVTEVDADYFKTGGIELGNTVWLTVDFGDGHGEYELPEFKKNAEVPSNLITKKRVKTNYASHQISWRITVNGNETESNRTDFDKIVVRENLSKGRGGSPTKFVCSSVYQT